MAELEVHTHQGEHGENPLILPDLTDHVHPGRAGGRSHAFWPSRTYRRLLLQAQSHRSMGLLPGKKYSSARNAGDGGPAGCVYRQDKEKTELLREKYQKEVERYSNDKDSISEKAKEQERERDLLRARADRFDAGEGILEIALVICSLTLLTDKKFFWYAAVLIGAVGIVESIAGFLHH
jgi:hypothetical protein